MAKKGPGNTASNRVNCAAYAFISLSRDNLLIVSTKRDKPPCVPVSRPVFRWLATLDTLAAAPDATLHRQKGSICMRVNASTLAFSPPPLCLSFFLSFYFSFSTYCRREWCNVCMTMGMGAGHGEQQPLEKREIDEEIATSSEMMIFE